MSSTFTAPIRINTRQTTSNDGTISADNTGAAVVSKQVALAGATAVTAVIPAGSIILNVQSFVTTAGSTPATPNVTVSSSTVSSTIIGTLSNAAGVNAITFNTTGANVAVAANVGTTDATVSFTAGAAAAGYLSITYVARNQDGTITPYGSGYTNN